MNVDEFFRAIWLLSAFSLTFCAGAGTLLGMKLDFDRYDHNVTP